MNARVPSRADRLERLLRGMLGLALVAAVAWALTRGGATPGLELASLIR